MIPDPPPAQRDHAQVSSVHVGHRYAWLQIQVASGSQSEWTLRWGDRDRSEGGVYDWYGAESLDGLDKYLICEFPADQSQKSQGGPSLRIEFHLDRDRELLEKLPGALHPGPSEDTGDYIALIVSTLAHTPDWRNKPQMFVPGEPTQIYAIRPDGLIAQADAVQN